MTQLSEMSWNQCLVGNHSREKPGFLTELLSRIVRRVLPPYSGPNDAMRQLLTNRKKFFDRIEEGYANDENLPDVICQEAKSAFDQLATIVSGDLESHPLHERIIRLELTPIFVPRFASGAEDEIPEKIFELVRLEHTIRDSYATMGTSVLLSYRTEKLISDTKLLGQLYEIVASAGNAEAQKEVLKTVLQDGLNERGILDFVDRKLDLVFEQIIEHNADTGERYIATEDTEYAAYFKSALLGGVLVAIFAVLKVYLGKLGLPPLFEALGFGLNYGICFSIVALVGGTIATKQPSMTAHVFSKTIDGTYSELTLLKTLVRSQFVTLGGNVIAASAVTLTLAAFVLPESETTVAKLLSKTELGLSLGWYAAIAGVLLSFAGLCSGYFANLIVFYRIPERVEARFGWLPSKRAKKIAPKVVGSMILGFLLGIAGPIGEATGLPIDIRHVAFSSAYAVWSGFYVPSELLVLGAGVAVIGTVNLVVSFIVTLFISRSHKSRRSANVPYKASDGN